MFGRELACCPNAVGETLDTATTVTMHNGDASKPFPLADVLARADGVPRSLPFHAVNVHFGHASFDRAVFPLGLSPQTGIHAVSTKTIVGSGANRMEIYPLRTVTGERQMMVYFPEHALL